MTPTDSPAPDGKPHQTSIDDEATERTHLLASSLIASAQDPDVAEGLTSTASSQPKPDSKPLPRSQIILLCYARLVEPIAFFSIFPYINAMLIYNSDLADTDVGFYSGLIESLFSLTQMSVMMLWGLAADRVGRKPVLVFSLIGVSIATALFGFARTIWQMILFRCIAGVFAGTIVTIRTMISEHSTKETQARAFSWFAFAGNLGILIGPLIGGALAEPATQYPRAFGNVAFFRHFPYTLPSFVVGIIGLSSVVTSALFVKETLKPKSKDGSDEPNGEPDSIPKPPTLSTWELVKSPGVGVVLYVYAHIMLLAFSYTAIVPVFWFTPIHLGGFGFTPFYISICMGLTGFSQASWLLLIFPPLQHRIGTNGVMRLCAYAYPIVMATCPLLNLLLRQGTPAAECAFWILAPIFLLVGPGVSMSFTAIQLALNDVSPSQKTLGRLNALALTGMSALRSFTPALFTTIFAVGARTQVLGGYLVWLVMVLISLGFTVVVRWLPAASERDYPGIQEDDAVADNGDGNGAVVDEEGRERPS
ncbi:permease of the major facilitator superfamily [Pseudomassariella vexata]|uniref:Permease of the major facilitator superfamily n=1 Tax=Pseudomassariella vexata TaxID=1141098 RepID=A0A1Y2EKX7_9PEZI|nr:permease of the major facilitator superfamily [Pseudomassariella vexata]ORY72168.1 permease of the major facilitator superfamily [Pseudomassariella vexata]